MNQLLKRLRDGQELDPQAMPREFMPRYRQPEVARQLIEIVRRIDEIIGSHRENWTWAHVMRVMCDEGILYKPTINRFDQIICSMVPNKGRDIVRKNGDYVYIMGLDTAVVHQSVAGCGSCHLQSDSPRTGSCSCPNHPFGVLIVTQIFSKGLP